MCFFRYWCPGSVYGLALQLFVQGLQAVQSSKTQSTSQECVLQATVSEVSGQGSPPWSSGVVTARFRALVPPPQSLVHRANGVHSPTAQSIGHFTPTLQARASFIGGHFAPNSFFSATTFRYMVCVPAIPSSPSQVFVHSSGTQGPNMQSWMSGDSPFIV